MSRAAVIVDYGLGNLFSIRQACRAAGISAEVSADPKAVQSAPMVILPGVGSFGDAMSALESRDLVLPLRDYAAGGGILFGVCLGMQLLLDESDEFGSHQGLGIIPGRVERLPVGPGLKVPQIGWVQVNQAGRPWTGTPLDGVRDREFFYFVHSYHALPRNPQVALANSRFGNVDYCCAVQHESVFGVQFHPEKSGLAGLSIYANLMRMASVSMPAKE